MRDLAAALRTSAIAVLAFTLLLGLAYPAVIGVIALALPHPAPAELVGQPIQDAAYFWSRPSALPGAGAMTSAATNEGPRNPLLAASVQTRLAALHAVDPDNPAPVPIDLVTASGSGLDPDISPEAAYYQIVRVARERGVPVARVRALVDDAIAERTFGILGERRVNVVALDRALDRAFGRPRSGAPRAAERGER